MATKYTSIVLDVGPSMSANPLRKRDAVDVVVGFLLNLLQFSKRDQVMIFLVGTPDTENMLFDEASDPIAYSHIVAAVHESSSKTGFDKPTIKLARGLRDLGVAAAVGPAAGEAGDLLDGIMLATWHLSRLKKPNCHILVVSDAESTIREVAAGDVEGLHSTVRRRFYTRASCLRVLLSEGLAVDRPFLLRCVFPPRFRVAAQILIRKTAAE